DSVLVRRSSPFATNAAANIVSFAHIRWNESLNVSALCRARWNTLFSAVEFDSGSALSADCRWRGAVAVHPGHVVPLALVRRTRCSLRSKTSTCRRPSYRRRWLFAFPATEDWRELLDGFLSAGGCSGIRHGHYRRAADHDRHERDRSKPRRDRIGSEQCCRAHGEPCRDCSFWSRDAPGVQNQSGSQIDQREFAKFSRAIDPNSIDQTRGHRHSSESKCRNTTGDPSRDQRIFPVRISLGDDYWRCACRCERSHYAVLD